jgi:hypothetical protein
MTMPHEVSYVRFIYVNWHADYVAAVNEKGQMCTNLKDQRML